VNQRRDHYRVQYSQTIVNLSRDIVASAGSPGEGLAKTPAGVPETSCQLGLSEKQTNESKLSTTDLLVLASMKNAAKCDK
jgi:hypothetical protein